MQIASSQATIQLENYLIGTSLETIGDIANIAGCGTFAIREIILVDRPRVVQAQGAVDSSCRILVVQLLQICFEVLCAGRDHAADLGLHEGINIEGFPIQLYDKKKYGPGSSCAGQERRDSPRPASGHR